MPNPAQTVGRWWSESVNLRAKTGNLIGNSFRWLFTGFLLAFLLVLTVAINEALNFQSRASRIAGDEDVARRAILVLHELRENGELKGERALPFGSMAVKLDAIQSAREGLSKFTGFGRAESDGAVEETVDAQLATAEFNELRAKLTQQVNGLEADLFAQDSGIKVARALVEIEEAIDVLDGFRIDIKSVEQQKATVDVAQQLQTEVQRLKEQIALIQNEFNIEPTSRVAENNLRGMQTLVGTLQQMEDTSKVVEAYRFRPLQAMDDRQDNGSIRQLATASSLPQFLVAVASAKDDWPLVLNHVKTTAPGPEVLALNYDDHLAKIAQHDQQIRAALSTAWPEFALANTIAADLNQMRYHLDGISQLPLHPEEFGYNDGSEKLDGISARERFNTSLGAMAEALQDLTRTLETRTPVVAIGEVIPNVGADATMQRHGKAQAILRDFIALERFGEILQPLQYVGVGDAIGHIGRLGFEPQQLATLSRDSLNLLFVLFIGAIGSVIYITKQQLTWTMDGNRLTDPPDPKHSLAWFVVRPLFGVFVAFAAYLMVRAGQMALGDDNAGLADTFNLPILSVVALFAGLMSWQALEAIEKRGEAWFRKESAERPNLWATGLAGVMQQIGQTRETCAAHVDRSVEQVDRWTAHRDPVTPEMQDRIATWLDRPLKELFSERAPV